MNGYFYDIESLYNAFTLANYRAKDNVMELYYLCDDPMLTPADWQARATDLIHAKNRNFDGACEYYDLHNADSVARLARTFGLSDAKYINNPKMPSSYHTSFRIVCDTDPEYDEELHPYLFGYNSFHYDTTMLTLFLYDTVGTDNKFYPTTARQMRQYNNELFDSFNDEKNVSRNMEDRLRYVYKDAAKPSKGFSGPDFKNPPFIIRKNMMMTGRHIDVARLNEKQTKVGLKRLLGMLGYQILESDKLRPGQDELESAEQFLELLAYNVSDVINLKKLAEHKTYTSGFTLKKQLLKTYPELVYEEKDDTYKPEISQSTVRKDRLTIDSSSAQFSTKSLCPYGHLSDYDTVSFMYPSEAKSKELGIPRVNVLEETKKFFYANFSQPEIRAPFDAIYDYYKQIEGKNFNGSKNYLIDHGIDPDASPDPEDELPDELRVWNLNQIKAPNTCMVYYNADGSPSTCFVNFSTGGIHGAEYNYKLYMADLKAYDEALKVWKEKVALFDKVKAIYPNGADLKKNKGVEIDGVKYKPSDFLKPKATVDEAYYKDPPAAPKAPSLFKENKNSFKLDPRYAYTSADPTQHEDFTSYYPNMLRMMDAFFNPGLGYDRYGEIFDDKTKYGVLMKDETKPKEERDLYSVMRNGTKLILNSASGAADANFDSNIRMNNKIISMRIIGQLFTWRIGQAQTIAGAKITSTNTDGLYSAGLEETLNNSVLAKESADIHVEIEPEPLFLISKDSNNRTEIAMDNGNLGDVEGASGASLACRKGPNPEKSLAHPAILDWAMTEYLACAAVGYKGSGLDKPFVNELGAAIISSARSKFNDDIQTLLMFQNMIASQTGSNRYVFATTDEDLLTPIPLQHYNRCFIVKDKTPGTVHLQIAAAKVITDTTIAKRKKENERMQQHDPMASAILAVQGIKTADLPPNKEAAVVKVSGVDTSWYILIENNDLHLMSKDRINEILDNLDYDKYLQLLRESFESNWFNESPEHELAVAQAKAAEKAAKKGKKTSLLDEMDKVDAEITSDDAAKPAPDEASAPDEAQVPVATAAPVATVADPKTDEDEPAPSFVQNGIANVPFMIPLQKSVLSTMDIAKAEHVLAMNGIREIDTHKVLAKVLEALTDTKIQ